MLISEGGELGIRKPNLWGMGWLESCGFMFSWTRTRQKLNFQTRTRSSLMAAPGGAYPTVKNIFNLQKWFLAQNFGLRTSLHG